MTDTNAIIRTKKHACAIVPKSKDTLELESTTGNDSQGELASSSYTATTVITTKHTLTTSNIEVSLPSQKHNSTDIAVCPSASPELRFLPNTDSEYLRVEQLFKSSWPTEQWPIGKSQAPEVVGIMEIKCKNSLVRKHEAYKATLGGTPNIIQGWHGARMTCNLGEFGKSHCCKDIYCNACLIMKNGVKTKFGLIKDLSDQRFGPGIYFSTISGKSNDYTHNSGCIMLFDVACGNMLEVDNGWWGPRPKLAMQYDSVFGKVGKELNYDEFVVYNDAAALPRYFVRFEWPRSRSLVCRPCKGQCWRPSPTRINDGSRISSRQSSMRGSPYPISLDDSYV